MARDRVVIVVLIDALGHRLVRDARAFEFLSGGESPVRSICGYSSACIPSLLSGKLPREHGHWAMYLRDPAHSIFRPYRPLILLLARALGRPYMTHRLVSTLLRRRGVDGYFNLYQIPWNLIDQLDLCQKRDLFAAGGLPGHETPFDAAERLGVPYRVWSWKTPEARMRLECAQELRDGPARMLFCYSPRLDAVMHAEGTRSAAARACLADAEAWVRELVALGEARGREVRLLVCGDHGMADVKAVHTILPELEALPLRMPRDFLYFVDSTMVRVWYRGAGVGEGDAAQARPGTGASGPAARAQVEALLRAKPFGRLIEEEERRRLGIDFPDGRYGETIFLMNAGEILAPSFMGRSAPRGMHGYHPDDPDSDTVLLSTFAHPPVESIRDIGPLIVREIEALAGTREAGAKPAGGREPCEEASASRRGFPG